MTRVSYVRIFHSETRKLHACQYIPATFRQNHTTSLFFQNKDLCVFFFPSIDFLHIKRQKRSRLHRNETNNTMQKNSTLYKFGLCRTNIACTLHRLIQILGIHFYMNLDVLNWNPPLESSYWVVKFLIIYLCTML